MKQINRRNFLKSTVATAAALATPLMASDKPDKAYKALVCILLEGGADTVNMLAPKYDLDGYDKYSQFSQELAQPKETLRTLLGSRYGLHQQMPKMQILFNYRDMAIVSGVGTLVHPLNKQMLEGSTAQCVLPKQLYSQPAQREQWMMAGCEDSGWAARVAKELGYAHVNVSVGGHNTMQSGDTQQGVIIPDAAYGSLEAQMKHVSQMIASREVLSAPQRQIFFVRHDVWNREALPLETIMQKDAASITELDSAIGGFTDTMRGLGLHENVTVMTMGDLARTVTPDGYGANRGWAGNMFVAGGAVRSGIYGTPIKQEPNSADMLPNQAVIPKIAADQYLATAVDWLCDHEIDLEKVFPNLKHFDTQTIGYLS